MDERTNTSMATSRGLPPPNVTKNNHIKKGPVNSMNAISQNKAVSNGKPVLNLLSAHNRGISSLGDYTRQWRFPAVPVLMPPSPPPPAGEDEGDRSGSEASRAIAIADGRHLDRVNMEQIGHGLPPFDFPSMSGWVDARGADRKILVPGDACTIAIADVRRNGWRLAQPVGTFPSQRSPVEGTVLTQLMGKISQSGTASGFDTLIFIGNGDEYQAILRNVLERELALVIVARSDLLSAGLKQLLRHPLARLYCLRRDLGVAV